MRTIDGGSSTLKKARMRPISILEAGRWDRFGHGADVDFFDIGAEGRSMLGGAPFCHGAASGAGSGGANLGACGAPCRTLVLFVRSEQ